MRGTHQKPKWATHPPPPPPPSSPSESESSGPLMFVINDHLDVLVEILKRMDGRTLARSACVCRLWASISLHDSLWENLIVRHLHLRPPSAYAASLRPVVLSMGGYRTLYTACVRPVLHRPLRSWDEVQLSLSLLSVDCYERRLIAGGGGPASSSSSSSLSFLCDLIASVHGKEACGVF
ncbi:F-box protein SNE-like protein [Cinnamomum micranthum f. kanehirae]|uniref:F-box protein SNE-like protein n=1 Tax=Cinnamomum micranthum f. kanehirae TaxID=337451 RepID=A0A3S3NP94_9MAGN|nr:F-box protein SNE-like protein [Cinnamomum micranthum f. kanehirae]